MSSPFHIRIAWLPSLARWVACIGATVQESAQRVFSAPLWARTAARLRLLFPGRRRRLHLTLLALRTGSPRERWEAAAALGRAPASPEVLAALIAALDDAEPFVRAEAAASLARFDARIVREALWQALGSGEPRRVVAAAEALGHLREGESVGPLLAALQTGGPSVRVSVLEALGRIGRAEALPTLLQALNDPIPAVRWAAAGALGRLGRAEASAALSARLAASVRPREAPTEAGHGQGGDLPTNEPMLVRRRLAWALGRTGGGSEATAALMSALNDVDTEVRRQAALALGALGDPAALPALRSLLAALSGEDDGSVAEAARVAIAALEARLAPTSPLPTEETP